MVEMTPTPSSTVRLSHLLIVSLLAYEVLMSVACLIYGPNKNVDGVSSLLQTAIVCELILLTWIGRHGRANHFQLWLVIFIGLYFCLPFLGYTVQPQDFPWYRDVDHPLADMNASLVLLILGTPLLAAGYSFGSRLFRRRPVGGPPARTLVISPRWFFVVGVGLTAVSVALLERYSVAFVGDAPFAGAWWRRLVGVEPLVFVGSIYLLEHWLRLSRWERLLFLIPIVSFISAKSLLGSRSAIFYVGLFVVQYFLVKRGDFRIRTRLIGGVAAATIVAIVIFPIASAVRVARAELFVSEGSLSAVDALSVVGQSLVENPLSLGDMALRVMQRLDYMDSLVIVMEGPLVDPSRHFGVIHDIKSSVNILVPGDPFPGVWEGANVFGLSYMGLDEEYFHTVQNFTAGFSIWGWQYARFGWLGGLGSLFVFGVACAGFYQFMSRWVPAPILIYAQVWLFLRLAFCVEGFGADTSLAAAVYDLVPYVPAIILMWPGLRWRRLQGTPARPSPHSPSNSPSLADASHPA